MTKFQEDESALRFARKLRGMGVEEELERRYRNADPDESRNEINECAHARDERHVVELFQIF